MRLLHLLGRLGYRCEHAKKQKAAIETYWDAGIDNLGD